MTDEQVAVVSDDADERPPGRPRTVPVVALVVVAGLVAACGCGGYALTRSTGEVTTAAVPSGTPRPEPSLIRLNRIGDGTRSGTIAATTMTVTAGGFAVDGKVARWGYLAGCTGDGCVPQEQRHVDVNFARDSTMTVTARFGVIDGTTSTEPVRFQLIADESGLRVLHDRTLAVGQSDDVSVVVPSNFLRFQVTGPLGQVTAGTVDPSAIPA